jgi:MSHA biogenesis protein MshP
MRASFLATAYRAQRGFSLVAALFLIVVVAALGAFAVRIGMGQQQTVNLALLSARALAAANSGIEYGAYQALNASNCASATLNLTEAGLSGFTVAVTCSASAHSESGGTVDVYRIEATASLGTYGMPDFVSRRVFATFASTP